MRRFVAFIVRFIARRVSRLAEAVLAKRVSDLEKELADVRQELAITENSLECAQHENSLLAEIHSADVSRRMKERAIYDSDRALAVATAQRTLPADNEE